MIYGLTEEEKRRMGEEGAKRMFEQGTCACCGKTFPLHMLDAKPERLAGNGGLLAKLFPRFRLAALTRALFRAEHFNRLECKECYGPGWVQGIPVLIRPKTLKMGSK